MTCLSRLIYGNRVPTVQMQRLANFVNGLKIKLVGQSIENLKTAESSLMADIRNGVYKNPIKSYDIRHFLKYSANYKSTSCYKNAAQKAYKESKVSQLRDTLLQYYDETGALRAQPQGADRRASIVAPSGSGDGQADMKAKLLTKFALMEAAAVNSTADAREGVGMFKRIMLDLDTFTAIVEDNSKSTLEKVAEINRKYGIACHQDKLFEMASNIKTIAGMLAITPDEEITTDWIIGRFDTHLPCINARLNKFCNWTPVVKIEQKVDKNLDAQTNIGIFHAVYIGENPNCDDAVKFYKWITDADGFLGATVKEDKKITVDDIQAYIVTDPLGYYAFSDESLANLDTLLNTCSVRF